MNRSQASAVLAVLILIALRPLIHAQAVIILGVEAGKPLEVPGVLHKPAGNGPFPAVVMLSGFGGYAGGGPNADHQSAWARRFVEWGYVALQVDSYSPRGTALNADFAGGITISRDAFAAKSWLSGLPFVDPGNIAVAGWSMGGTAALKAIDEYFREQGAAPFKAAVAFYPVCYPVYEPDTPLLFLTGRKDEICRASVAEGLKKKYVDQDWKPEMSFTVYPNAYHSFDMEGVDFESSGRHYRWDPEAAGDAIARTKDFLSRYLEGGRQ